MRGTIMYSAGDVRIENVPDPRIIEPTDAIMRVVRACICGSDLWPYNSMAPSETGQSMGHEAIGVVEEIGADVGTVKRGDVVVMPFAISDGTCEFCHEGLDTACVHVGFFGSNGMNGAQAEALRVPFADGTLYPLPVGEDDALMPSLLTLSDVMGTGHHAAVAAKVAPGKRVALVGDGAVGLCGVIAAKRLGAEQIIMRDLAGQVALVTGASSGMGLATARAFAEQGASVALADTNEDAPRRRRLHRRLTRPSWFVPYGVPDTQPPHARGPALGTMRLVRNNLAEFRQDYKRVARSWPAHWKPVTCD
jgi:Zn-dependent alcohol dehydrogenase